MKLGNVVTVKVGMSDADFWIVRRGSENMVGKPVKVYDPEYIGIKVNTDQILPDYLYYWFMNLHNTGHWKSIAQGTTRLVNIRTEDIKNIPIG